MAPRGDERVRAAALPPQLSGRGVCHARAGSRSDSGAGALPVPKEDAEQRTLAAWLDLAGVRWCHVPNGGFRRPAEARIFRALGVKPGVPDVLIFTAPPAAPHLKGTAIELKRRVGGEVSSEQLGWMAALEELGWAVALCRGACAAIDTLHALGYRAGYQGKGAR